MTEEFDKTKSRLFREQLSRRTANKPFSEPTDRPFASISSMSAQEFEQAFQQELQDEGDKS